MCTPVRSSAAGPAAEASPRGGAIAAGVMFRLERERVKLLCFTRVKGNSYLPDFEEEERRRGQVTKVIAVQDSHR